MLCTGNAIQSRWVPWDVGIADTQKAFGKILIAPVADNQGRFNGSEYLPTDESSLTVLVRLTYSTLISNIQAHH